MEQDVFLINKMFTGSFTTDNIGHEIINFFKADSGENFLYVLPYGGYNVKKCKELNEKVTQVILTSSLSCGRVEILAVADVSDSPDMGVQGNRGDQEVHQKQLELLKDITYGEQNLEDIFQKNPENDRAIYVTFKVKSLKRPKAGLKIYLSNNPGDKSNEKIKYIYLEKNLPHSSPKAYCSKIRDEGKYAGDFERVAKALKGDDFENYETRPLDTAAQDPQKLNLNSLQIMDKEDEEQIYTNLLYYWFSRKNIFWKFLEYLGTAKMARFLSDEDGAIEYKLQKEKVVPGGRMDIFAQSTGEPQKAVIIENKILSGLNGVDEKGTQLDAYVKAALKDGVAEENILGLVFAPDYNAELVEQEVKKLLHDGTSRRVFQMPAILYSELRDFFEKVSGDIKSDMYEQYYDDFLNMLGGQAYKTITEKNQIAMQSKFLNAIRESENK